MRGGDILASGGQGCIFYPALEPLTTNNIITAVPSSSTNIVSKVFFNEEIFENERTILEEVMKATNSIGIIPYINYFMAFAIDENNKLQLKSSSNYDACRVVNKTLNDNKPIFILNQPRINGTIEQIDEGSKSLSFFKNALIALLKLQKAGIVQMDMAERNIFYDTKSAYVSDFGSAININKNFESSLLMYINQYIPNIFLLRAIFNSDQITPEAYLCISLWYNWDSVQFDNIKENMHMFNNRTFTKVAGKFYSEYLNVINKATEPEMNKKKFLDYCKSVLVWSDIKMFIKTILPFTTLDTDKQTYILHDIWHNNDTKLFFDLCKQEGGKRKTRRSKLHK